MGAKERQVMVCSAGKVGWELQEGCPGPLHLRELVETKREERDRDHRTGVWREER